MSLFPAPPPLRPVSTTLERIVLLPRFNFSLHRTLRCCLCAVGKESPGTNSYTERSEADKIVDGIDFGQLCDEFVCISSPAVEFTARQLVREILELRRGNRALEVYSSSVVYKDPVRSFTGNLKYKRRTWAAEALENPTASVQEMVMLSTSILKIEWTLKGKIKLPITEAFLIVKVKSEFTINQISGQVIEHEEVWDPSASSLPAQAYFWISKRIFAATEAVKDASDFLKDLGKHITSDNKKNVGMYPDISGDPMKFFEKDDGFQQDLYQIALFLAVAYFIVQFLRATM